LKNGIEPFFKKHTINVKKQLEVPPLKVASQFYASSKTLIGVLLKLAFKKAIAEVSHCILQISAST
jgi:hypothetical protein